jgi:hypothetical protein
MAHQAGQLSIEKARNLLSTFSAEQTLAKIGTMCYIFSVRRIKSLAVRDGLRQCGETLDRKEKWNPAETFCINPETRLDFPYLNRL